MPLENDVQELTKAIRDLIHIMTVGLKAPLIVSPGTAEAISACPPIPAALKRTKTKEPEPETPSETEVTYDQVKAAVLEVAKTKGREASLDLLAPFGVVSGEGEKRTGSITKLKPEQFAAVIASAQAVLS